jgi:hypothetical protein
MGYEPTDLVEWLSISHGVCSVVDRLKKNDFILFSGWKVGSKDDDSLITWTKPKRFLSANQLALYHKNLTVHHHAVRKFMMHRMRGTLLTGNWDPVNDEIPGEREDALVFIRAEHCKKNIFFQLAISLLTTYREKQLIVGEVDDTQYSRLSLLNTEGEKHPLDQWVDEIELAYAVMRNRPNDRFIFKGYPFTSGMWGKLVVRENGYDN